MRTIKLMKENNATDESGMIAEYVKALGDQDLNNLRRLLNDVLMGGCIPKEWKESRVVLVHKGGSKKELKNYRPVAIINVVCKLFMRENKWMGGREWHARRYTGGFQNGAKDRG